jgi:hypothetical protein
VSDPLPVFRVIAEPLAQDLADDMDLGRRSKFGGKQTWIQNDDTPICEHCAEPMMFVAQLDSIGFRQKEAEGYMFGDVGLIYVFFCFNDGTTSSIFQCT